MGVYHHNLPEAYMAIVPGMKNETTEDQEVQKEKKRKKKEEEGIRKGKKAMTEDREKNTWSMISQAVMICRKKSLWIGEREGRRTRAHRKMSKSKIRHYGLDRGAITRKNLRTADARAGARVLGVRKLPRMYRTDRSPKWSWTGERCREGCGGGGGGGRGEVEEGHFCAWGGGDGHPRARAHGSDKARERERERERERGRKRTE
jgi:hypothetical protein